jgi:hypothetical protein
MTAKSVIGDKKRIAANDITAHGKISVACRSIRERRYTLQELGLGG